MSENRFKTSFFTGHRAIGIARSKVDCIVTLISADRHGSRAIGNRDQIIASADADGSSASMGILNREAVIPCSELKIHFLK